METVEHGERYHQGHRGHDDTHNGDAADDVDGVRGLLGEQIALSYIEWEIHFLAL